jgi:lysophospholipase L1-like esterase
MLLPVAGCWAGSGAQPSAAPRAAAPRYASYVALGDSYTAAPLVPTTDVANGCFRSDHNYPNLVAQRLHVQDFTDVSCSGAATGDLTGRQHTYQEATVPPQLAAVGEGTDLVTIGIGGNDFDLFGTLVGTCTRLRARDPAGAPCARALSEGDGVAATTGRISDRVTRALREVRRRAPRATVVLVGYLRLVPDRGRCPQVPLATGDYAFARRVSRDLADALGRAARRAGVRYVDGYALSAGHDACSAHPWVNGGTTRRHRALAFHPFAAGERALARAVVDALGDD